MREKNDGLRLWLLMGQLLTRADESPCCEEYERITLFAPRQRPLLDWVTPDTYTTCQSRAILAIFDEHATEFVSDKVPDQVSLTPQMMQDVVDATSTQQRLNEKRERFLDLTTSVLLGVTQHVYKNTEEPRSN